MKPLSIFSPSKITFDSNLKSLFRIGRGPMLRQRCYVSTLNPYSPLKRLLILFLISLVAILKPLSSERYFCKSPP